MIQRLHDLNSRSTAEAAVMRCDALGPPHGLPLGVKDLLDPAGLLRISGTISRRNHVPAHDNTLVARLRAAAGLDGDLGTAGDNAATTTLHPEHAWRQH